MFQQLLNSLKTTNVQEALLVFLFYSLIAVSYLFVWYIKSSERNRQKLLSILKKCDNPDVPVKTVDTILRELTGCGKDCDCLDIPLRHDILYGRVSNEYLEFVKNYGCYGGGGEGSWWETTNPISKTSLEKK